MAANILIADDEARFVGELSSLLEAQGYQVAAALDPEAFFEQLDKSMPDLVLLDIAFSEADWDSPALKDGLDVLKQLRRISNVPVLMLTGVSVSLVKVLALSSGADDYITKPFDESELLARIGAVLRRTRGEGMSSDTLECGGLVIDRGSRQAFKGGELLDLTALEFDLLYALASRAGRVMSRSNLIHQAWSYEYAGDERVVDVHIMNLRRAVEDDPANPKLIVTVRGRGYRFDALTPAESGAAQQRNGASQA